MSTSDTLSSRGRAVADRLLAAPERYGVQVHTLAGGARLVDCGVAAPGGEAAGLALADICLARRADVTLDRGPVGGRPTPVVRVEAANPWLPCLASQYAGWRVSDGKFVGMGSGPARAVAAVEPLLERLGYREPPQPTVLVLEADRLPTDGAAARVAAACRIAPADLVLAAAATGSAAGTLQIAARSVETALHKLDHLGFDVRRVRRGGGTCPVSPPVEGFLEAFGRTNDAILYGCEVELAIDADGPELAALAPRVPSSASPDWGVPCAELLRRVGGDFYKIDPTLFSPARVTLVGRDGARHEAGRLDLDLVARSFYGNGSA
jgi:methenyltetrahydromethanopterin cyclohydrolase